VHAIQFNAAVTDRESTNVWAGTRAWDTTTGRKALFG
jgi:hypothetical protein